MLQLAASGRSALGRIHKRDASGEHRASCFRSPPFNVLNVLPRRKWLPNPFICRRQAIDIACGASRPGTEEDEEEADAAAQSDVVPEAPLADEGAADENDDTVESRTGCIGCGIAALNGGSVSSGYPCSQPLAKLGARSLAIPRATINRRGGCPTEVSAALPRACVESCEGRDLPSRCSGGKELT